VRAAEVMLRELNAPSWLTRRARRRRVGPRSSHAQDTARTHGIVTQNARILELVRKTSELLVDARGPDPRRDRRGKEPLRLHVPLLLRSSGAAPSLK
jgi:hypothetical protein